MTKKTKAKRRGRGPSQRLVRRTGHGLVSVSSVAALAEACAVATITIKRVWEPRGVLPKPTFVDANGVRWYSDAYIRSVADTVRFYRAGHRGRRSDLELLKRWIADDWRRKKAV